MAQSQESRYSSPMLSQPPKGREVTAWLYVAGWTLFIYTCIPLARALQKVIDERWGRELFIWAVGIAVLVSLGVAAACARRSAGAFRLREGAWLVGTATLFGLWTWHLRSAPEEALHFIQYGALSLLVYRALLYRLRDVGIYASAVLVAALLGSVDEIIQWATPRRFFDFRDIALNAGSALLVQVGLAKGIRPALITRTPSPRGIRLAARLASLQLVVLGVCISNTIPRVEWYASRIPGLDFLRTNESIMIEFGYRYEDPDIGVFFSRFPPEALAHQDATRAEAVAEIVNRYRDPRLYGAFLATYTPATDPFAHEARVHLYRRDRYRGFAVEAGDDEQQRAEHYTVAYREHLIMTKYFSNTLHASRYRLGEDYVAFLRKQQLPDEHYESAVSAQLVTRLRTHHFWLMILFGIVALETFQRYCGRRLGPGNVSTVAKE